MPCISDHSLRLGKTSSAASLAAVGLGNMMQNCPSVQLTSKLQYMWGPYSKKGSIMYRDPKGNLVWRTATHVDPISQLNEKERGKYSHTFMATSCMDTVRTSTWDGVAALTQ